MNELQRQAYMDAVGVDCYAPRLQLPGAKASQLCVMPVADTPVVLGEVSPNTDQAPVDNSNGIPSSPAATAGGSSARVAAMQALFDEPPKRAQAQPAQAALAELVDQADVTKPVIPQFALSIIRGSHILIIDEALPGHSDPAEYLQLLQNMLFALGDGRPQLTIDRFVWPMSRNAQIDQTETAARQTLEAFLAKQVEQLNTRYILVMGQTAAHYICLEEITAGEFIKHPQLDAQLIHSQSAVAMLADAEIKRHVWRDLQPLYRVLKKH